MAAMLGLVGMMGEVYAQVEQRPPAEKRVGYKYHSLRVVGGGFITGVMFHPTVKGLAYCRTDIGGAYRWDEVEHRWTALSAWISAADANLIGVESIALDPLHPDDLYLAVGTYTHPESPNGALLRSHDRGRSFETIALPFKLGANEEGRFAGERLALDPAHAGTMYLGTRLDGLWRSTDSGSTWTRVTSFPGHAENGVGITFVLFGPKRDGSAGAMYAGVSTPGDSLFLSEDGGASWQLVNGAPRGQLPNHGVFDASGALYLTYGNRPGPNDMTVGSVWRRSREGAWKDVTPEAAGGGGGYGGLALDLKHDGTVVVSTMDRWKTGDTLFLTEDGGRRWVSLRERARMDASLSPWLRDDSGAVGMGHWMGAIAIDPFDPDHMMYGTGETLWVTHNARKAERGRPTDWTVGAEGIEETAVLALTSPPSGAPLFMGLGDIGCYRSDDVSAGVAPTRLTPPRLSNCDSISVAAGVPIRLVMSGRVWTGKSHGGFSEDGGRSWTRFATEPDAAESGGRVVISGDGASLLWTTRAGAFGSKDNGRSWKLLVAGNDMEAIADRATPASFYLIDRARGVLSRVTLDGGLKELQTQLHQDLHLLASSKANELWLFGPGGVTQVTPTGELKKLNRVHSADGLGLGKAMIANGVETLFLAGDVEGERGVWRSSDEGATWVRIDDPVRQFGVISPISGDARVPGRVYLGTNGFGVVVGEQE